MIRARTLGPATALLSIGLAGTACAPVEPMRREPLSIAIAPTSKPEAPVQQPPLLPPWKIVTSSLPPAPLTPKPLGRLTDSHDLTGIASFYWQEQMTANGERFDKTQMTAAHRTLPFGTKVRVVDKSTGRSVVVRINDRGPFKPGRVIDLSLAAAQALGMEGRGLTPVAIEVVSAN